MPNSDDKKTEPVTGAEIVSDNDLFGQMTRGSWSCLVLDVADRLVKYAGKPGRELYYRMAQQVEARSTGYGGAEEAKIRSIFRGMYVDLSIQQYNLMVLKTDTWVDIPSIPLSGITFEDPCENMTPDQCESYKQRLAHLITQKIFGGK